MTGGPRSTVGVNLLWLVPGVVGGSEEYTLRTLLAIEPALAPGIELRIYCRADLVAAYPELAELHRTVVAPPHGSKPARIALEQSWLAAASRHDDVVHHAGGTIPFVRPSPAIVTVHDPQPLDQPDNFSAVKRRWLHRVLPYSVARARLVLCPSRFTAERLSALLDVPADKLRVVQHGHSPTVSQPAAEKDTATAENDTATAGGGPVEGGRRYLLYPAIAYPHKRHIDVVNALDQLGSQFDDLHVVFTSRPGPEADRVSSAARRLGLGDRVHFAGRIPAAELDRLYRGAEALVFPSAYEGFGNPALEAMALGCPAIVSDAGALPEVVGDAGLIFPVGDVGALAGGVAKVLSDRSFSDDLRRRGLQRAARFEVGIAAAQLAAVYGELVDSRMS